MESKYDKKFIDLEKIGVTHIIHRGVWITCLKFVDSYVNNY